MPFTATQLEVLVSVIVIFVLTAALAAVMTKRYLGKRSRALAFWSAGLWVFTISVFLEILFALDIYPNYLIDAYLFLVVVLVECLALGSIQLIRSDSIRNGYYAFAAFATLLALYTIMASAPPSAWPSPFVETYVAAGSPTLLIIISSTIATTVAAAVIVIIAAKSYLKKRSTKLLSIIAGVVVVSIAGTLYIASVPEFLYYSEFVGILLLWWGFI